MRSLLERNRIDRLPTPVERLIGILGSGIILALGIAIIAFLLATRARGRSDLSALAIAYAVGSILAALGAHFLRRFVRTTPELPSPRAARIAYIALGLLLLAAFVAKISVVTAAIEKQ